MNDEYPYKARKIKVSDNKKNPRQYLGFFRFLRLYTSPQGEGDVSVFAHGGKFYQRRP